MYGFDDDILKQVEIDHVIKDGKVYFEAEELASKLALAAISTTGVGLSTADPSAMIVAEGYLIIGELLLSIQSELLRREADAAFKA